MRANSCPTHEKLVSFVLGKLDDQECSRITRHLEECAACQAIVFRVDDRADSLLIRLRGERKDTAKTREDLQPPVAPPAPQQAQRKLGSTAKNRSQPLTTVIEPPTKPKTRDIGKRLLTHRLSKYRRRKTSRETTACYISGLLHITLIALLSLVTIHSIRVGSAQVQLVTTAMSDELDGSHTFPIDVLIPRDDSETAGDAEVDAFDSDSWRLDVLGPIDGTTVMPPTIPPTDTMGLPTEVGTDGIAGLNRDKLSQEAPDHAPSNPREVHATYDTALHQLVKDIYVLLEESNVLLVWCLDRSESMRDDVETLHKLLDRVYDELDETGSPTKHRVRTAITSFGEQFHDHTEALPVEPKASVLQHFGAVGFENTGVENMCSAALSVINNYDRYARVHKCRMVLAIVSDESGNKRDNLRWLEPLIARAKDRNARMYVFGREAAFGHQVAFVHWNNPETGHTHPITIDLGPESPFEGEQLLIDCFGLRQDAHPSGFGPYDQSRLVKETGGRFFLLPGHETNLKREASDRYSLDAVTEYQPFLGSRSEYMTVHLQDDLPKTLTTIVKRFDPRRFPDAVLQQELSPNMEEFRREIVKEAQKARHIIALMDHGLMLLDELALERERERSPRWQANYDLLKAQLLLYRLRLSQYIRYLAGVQLTPPKPPRSDSPLYLWSRMATPVHDLIQTPNLDEHVAQVKRVLMDVEDHHPGTPWAARAKWERQRGFGVVLRPSWRRIKQRPVFDAPKL